MAIAMVFEVGPQKPAVVLLIAVNLLEDMALAPPSAVYAVVMVTSSAVMARVVQRYPSIT